MIKEIIWSWDIRIVIAVALIAQTLIATMIGISTYRLAGSGVAKVTYRKINKSRIDRINSYLLGGSGSKNNYEVIEAKLKSHGYKFYYKGIMPSDYITRKIYFAICGAMIGLVIFRVLGLITGLVIGYYIIDIVTEYRNRKDNVELIDDVRIIMAAMRIQGSANIYITDIITECYYEVSNKRLKKALLELTGEIRAKEDINDAIDRLNEKFDSRYIKSLCTVIKQLFKSGKSSNMIEYINKHMLALQREMITKERAIVEKDKLVSTFIIFGIILICIFGNAFSVLDTSWF